MTEGKADDVRSRGHSMAKAKLLVVILKVRRRYGRTYNYAAGSRGKNRRRGTSAVVSLGGIVLLLVRMMVLMLMKAMVTVLKLE